MSARMSPARSGLARLHLRLFISHWYSTAAGDENDVMLQQGAGQAELSGATISGNDTEGLISGDIFLTDNAGMEWIELAFFGVTGTSIDFTLSGLAADGATPEEFAFNYLLDGSGVGEVRFRRHQR